MLTRFCIPVAQKEKRWFLCCSPEPDMQQKMNGIICKNLKNKFNK